MTGDQFHFVALFAQQANYRPTHIQFFAYFHGQIVEDLVDLQRGVYFGGQIEKEHGVFLHPPVEAIVFNGDAALFCQGA